MKLAWKARGRVTSVGNHGRKAPGLRLLLLLLRRRKGRRFQAELPPCPPPEASRLRDGEPTDGPASLQAPRVSPPAASIFPGATLGESNEGGDRAEPAGSSGDAEEDGEDDGGARQEREASAASLQSARSAGSRCRSPRQQHQQHQQHQQQRGTKHVSNPPFTPLLNTVPEFNFCYRRYR